MNKNLKFLFLIPVLMAALCDPIDDACGFDEPDKYTVSIENVAESYMSKETIWISGETSSMVIDFCTETETPELIEDAEVFLAGIFVLKLENSPGLNAKIVTDFDVIFDEGDMFTFNGCSNSINVLPVLNNDMLSYTFRLGISITEPGDYCFVDARSNNFNLESENNAVLFETYNTLDNEIKFENCDVTFTRLGVDGHYFFSIL